MEKLDLAAVNGLGYEEFTDKFGNVIEHCPVLAAAAWSKRPFADFNALHAAFCAVLDDLPVSVQEGVLRCHPDLAGRLAELGTLTSESRREQASAGLLDLTDDERRSLSGNNASYKRKFRFPFVICAGENRKAAILEQMAARQGNSGEVELATGLGEVKKIARLRLENIVRRQGSNM